MVVIIFKLQQPSVLYSVMGFGRVLLSLCTEAVATSLHRQHSDSRSEPPLRKHTDSSFSVASLLVVLSLLIVCISL